MQLNLKQIKLLATINLFLLSFISHFLYQWFPNILMSFFFPVNESIFEHMKIIFTTIILYSIIDYYLLTKNKIKFQNFPFQIFLTSFISIPIYLALYLPINYLIGEKLLISILLLLITYIISQIISYHILIKPTIPYLNTLTIPLIIIIYIIFIILTYYPPHYYLFYDKTTNSYGILKEYAK